MDDEPTTQVNDTTTVTDITQPEPESNSASQQRPTVVGLGASAGGLAALQSFFDALPDDTGMAFVVVTHMDPQRESLLPELLQAHTQMPVQQVTAFTTLEANHVYVIAPNQRLVITDSHLDVEEFEEPRGKRLPIDYFFRSLAAVHRDAVAVICSGGGTDGAVGVKTIKEQGGLLLVQHPDEAEHDSMPRAAISTGLADVVLPMAELAEKLVAYSRNGVHVPRDPEALTAAQLETVYRILTQVQVHTGHDFSQYKRSTILRRIQRRMQLHGHTTLDAYLNFLRHQSDEAAALFNDMLIGVTNFFRDDGSWQALAEQVVPQIFQDKEPQDSVRVWTIGCATGEEAYTIAMLLIEHLESSNIPSVARPRLQVFASDLDDLALGKAREGFYPEVIEADVSPERLARFFIKEGNYYRIKREVRDIVLFSSHSVLRDPPFSRLDLISCRNLLIYLQREVQQNIFQIFHYALNPECYLFLGSSESADSVNKLFRTLDRTHRLYQARPWRGEYPEIPTLPLRVPHFASRQHGPLTPSIRPRAHMEHGYSAMGYHLALLEEGAPASVLVDESYHIVHTSQTAGRYLVHPGGVPTTDLLKLVRSELQYELRAALSVVFKENKNVVSRPVYVQFNGTPHRVTLAVRLALPTESREMEDQDQQWALIFFLEDEVTAVIEKSIDTDTDDEIGEIQLRLLVTQLEEEVQRLRERLQTSNEEYESSNEELKAANEELQSINEEYRSATEELETSKEELQSVNEELQTVNTELKNKLEEISRAHSDLENLLTSTEIATLFLDRELRIQRYTPSTIDLFNIMPGDQGRPISHLTHKLEYDNLAKDAKQVLRNLIPIQNEVCDAAGRQLLVRLRPYRTVHDRIDGVVLTFVDITTIRETERALERTRERYGLLAEGTTEYAMFTMDEGGRIDTWNQGARRIFGYKEAEVMGKTGDIIFTPEAQAVGEPTAELAQARQQGEAGAERWYQRQDGTRFWGSGVVTVLRESGQLRGYAKVMRDNTVRKTAQESLQESETRYRNLAATLEERVQQRTAQARRLASELLTAEQAVRHRIAHTLHDDMQQLLYAARLHLQFLRDEMGRDGEFDNMMGMLDSAFQLTRQLTVELSPPVLQEEGLRAALVWLARHMRETYQLQVTVEVRAYEHPPNEEHSILLFQTVRELLFNAVKHADISQARVTLKSIEEGTTITVKDGGKGFDTDTVLAEDGDGFGLRNLRERLLLFDGSVTITSAPGEGTYILLFLPHFIVDSEIGELLTLI